MVYLASHKEKHFRSTETLRDILIGMADGLTVPFALAAGLTSAAVGTGLIVKAGFAEIAAGAIAMGLGGYLAARTESEHYETERKREFYEIAHYPERETREVADILQSFGVDKTQLPKVVAAISEHPERWVDFMMRFELGLEKPDPARATVSAITIGLSYIFGGLIPLLPYLLLNDLHTALLYSSCTTAVALFVFGAIKGRLTGMKPLITGLQTLAIGGTAAAVAYLVAGLF